MTIPNSFCVGTMLKITVTFTDEDGVLTDPTDVYFAHQLGRGPITNVVSWPGGSTPITHVSTGVFSVKVSTLAMSQGQLKFTYLGTGALEASVSSFVPLTSQNPPVAA